jgi:hypothetical protein
MKMSINAAPRTTEQSIRRFEATILRLPVQTRELDPAFEANARVTHGAAEMSGQHSSLLIPALLAVLLVLCCVAWETLSGRWF